MYEITKTIFRKKLKLIHSMWRSLDVEKTWNQNPLIYKNYTTNTEWETLVPLQMIHKFMAQQYTM